MELFEDPNKLVKICAPMVRYSKLPFRLLVQDYDCDLSFSPMMIAESFVQSEKCRNAEFATIERDRPLIVQFAANSPTYFADAAELVYNDCNGVDLNCGCPQTWARQAGIGSCLMRTPEVVADILKQTRNRISDPNFSVSVKVRVFGDERRTVDMCRQLEAAGISFLSVHGRTSSERCEAVRLDTIRSIVDALDIPVVANGDVCSLQDADRVSACTGARGVMSARGILANPGLYAGHSSTPVSAVKRWIEINRDLDTPFIFFLFHSHLMYMTKKLLTKSERLVFNNLKTREDVEEFLNKKFDFEYNESLKT